MTDLKSDFDKFLNKKSDDKRSEIFLIERLDLAVSILKRALPFITTWYKSSHAGTGDGAKNLMIDISEFLRGME